MKNTSKLLVLVLALMVAVACASVTVYADEVPTLEATEDTVLAYVDFDQNMDDVDIDDNTVVENGIATMNGNGEIVFDETILDDIVDDTFIVEFVIKPAASPEHGILFSAGPDRGKCIITGTRGNGAFKYTGFDTDANVVAIGEWMVVKYIITSTHVQIFVDGEMVKEADNDTNFEGAAEGPMKFGKYTVGIWQDPGYNGAVSEIRLSTPKAASSDDNNDAGNDDAGNNDAGNNDAGNDDAGNNDTGNDDAGNDDAGNDDAGNDNTGKEEKPETGDASAILALVVAGAAALVV